MKNKLALSAVVLAVAFGSVNQSFAFGKAKPNPEPTATATATPDPTPTLTVTPEPIPTVTPTPTPTATLVPVPAPTPTAAAPEILLGDVSAGGTGCVGGFLSSEISFDNLMVRMTFDQFLAQITNDGKTLDRKACSVAIPILQAAPGKKLVVSKVILVGSRDLATGSSAKVGFEAFFTGSQGQRMDQTFDSSNGAFEVVQNDAAELACGAVGIFRVNASALVQNFGSARVDEVVVFFKLLSCQSE